MVGMLMLVLIVEVVERPVLVESESVIVETVATVTVVDEALLDETRLEEEVKDWLDTLLLDTVEVVS